jgi:hypothetical protein
MLYACKGAHTLVREREREIYIKRERKKEGGREGKREGERKKK